MTPAEFLSTILVPGLQWLEQIVGPVPPPSHEARLLLLAIAGQESNWTAREQTGGPAHGFWQFEKGGGVAGVMSAAASADMAYKVANACDVIHAPANTLQVYEALAIPQGDNLAVAFARLLLWTDPHSLPAYGDESGGWTYYNWNWRPGKPSRDRWAEVYPQALAADRAWTAGAKP